MARLSEQRIFIGAPSDAVFAMLANGALGYRQGTENSVRVLSRKGNCVAAEFITSEHNAQHRTLEEIRAYPPDRIEFHWLESSIKSMRNVVEEILVLPAVHGTELRFGGRFELAIPVVGRLLGPTVARRRFDTLVALYLQDIKFAAEALVRLGEGSPESRAAARSAGAALLGPDARPDTIEAYSMLAGLESTHALITGMARAVEAKDRYTHGHADRVTAYAVALAKAAGLQDELCERIAQAGILHDVGKIGVPDHVLHKPGPLNPEERAAMERHPVIGDEICSPMRSLLHLRDGIRYHHERFDGQGYPDRLAGAEIPLEARVLAIADAFDAMTSDRPYRAGMPVERALQIIAANQGPQWDPALAPVFCALHTESAPSVSRLA